MIYYDDAIKWKHFPRYLTLVRGIHRPVTISPHKGQWRGALIFSLCLEKAWANNRDGGDFGRHRAHYDATVILEHSYDNESVSEVIFETWVKLTDAGPKQYEARYMYIINGMRFMLKLFTRSYARVIYDSVHLGQLLCLLHRYSVFNSALSLRD